MKYINVDKMACGVVVSMFDSHRSDRGSNFEAVNFHNANIYTIVPSGSNSFVLCPWMYVVFVLSTVAINLFPD